MVFAHKAYGYGQAAIFSYGAVYARFIVLHALILGCIVDNGSTSSTNVYELHKGGLYAQSITTTDGTVVTCTANYKGDASDPLRRMSMLEELHALQWRPPPRENVSAGGLMAPLGPQIHFVASLLQHIPGSR
jgi:hypothetical protein